MGWKYFSLSDVIVMSMGTKNIHIELDDDQFDALDAKKDREGLTWKGVLLHGWDLDECDVDE